MDAVARATAPIRSYFFEKMRGSELMVGDKVAKYDEDNLELNFIKPDEVLVSIAGKCDKGIHFRTHRGSIACYDPCAYNLVAR